MTNSTSEREQRPTLQSEKLERPCEGFVNPLSATEALHRAILCASCRWPFGEHYNSRAPVVAPQLTGEWRQVHIPSGNQRVVAIEFETAEQATEFINRFASSPASSPVRICAWCKEEIITMYFGTDGNRYCSVDCQLQYEGETRRAGANWESAATPTPVEQAASFTPKVAAQLIHLRDTLAKMESSELVNEAWHTLYSIADPKIESFFPWSKLEERAVSADSVGEEGK